MYKFEKKPDLEHIEGYLDMGESNPQGEHIYANNMFYTRNGKPFCPVMGEMHITRNPRSAWRDRILKLKAQGINIISSYLIWINHEFYEGSIDFTGENDIREFIKICNDEGMYFSLRIGPWITSECRNGGLPDWIYDKCTEIRTNNETYLYYVRRWYAAVYEQVKDFLYKNGGNIIMLQFDNELTNKPEHLSMLKKIAAEEGITAPIYYATGWNMSGGARLPKTEVIPMFGGYSEKPWAATVDNIRFYSHYKFSHIRNSADVGDDLIDPTKIVTNIDNNMYPYSMCELGMGLCTSKHRRPHVTDKDNYGFVITKVGSGCNLIGYYMSCGGINRMIDGNTLNMDNLRLNKNSNTYPIFSFDFQASIREHGSCTSTHRKNKLVNYFMNNFGTDFVWMQPKLQEPTIKENDTENLRYAMRVNQNGGGYIFVNHHCHMLPLKPVYGVQFEVADQAVPIPATPFDVTEDDSFFFPFNQNFGGADFEYILAQPICKTEDTYFFKQIRGVKPEIKFKGEEPFIAKVGKDNGFCYQGVKFIMLSDAEAECLYQFDGKVYIGRDCDLVCDNHNVKVVGFAAGTYDKYENGQFIAVREGTDYSLAVLEINEVDNPDIDKRYQYELFKNRNYLTGAKNGAWYDVDRKVKYYELSVSNANGYVHIDYSGDSAQLYYDGQMSDDDFYNGHTWIIPAAHMFGRKVILAIAEYTHDIYVECPPKQDLGIDSIVVKAV